MPEPYSYSTDFTTDKLATTITTAGVSSGHTNVLGSSPIDSSYQPKIVKCEKNGIVKTVSERILKEASSHFDDAYVAQSRLAKDKPTRGPERKVMVLYTGGTIGMKIKNGVYVPESNYLPKAIRAVPHLHDQEYADHYFPSVEVQPYVLPFVHREKYRIVYWLFEYEPLLDSSDMTFDDWIKIAKDIFNAYENYDGFVILHGTDTLCYTASALSFMFENLSKPIIITGAQIPVVEVRSDGRENLIGALILAANYDVPEVCVYFNNKLMRGNRTSKVDNSGLDAFNSPNCSVLASVEVNIHVDWDNIFRSAELKPVVLQQNLNRNVGLLRIFPSVTVECIRAFLAAPLEGIVLQTFGAGNIPSNRKDLIEELKKAVDRGAIIVNCSQCSRGQVDAQYHTGAILYEIGVTAGSDMTPEAALTKLAYVLGKSDWGLETKKKMMGKNLRGELTITKGNGAFESDSDIIRKIARFLQRSDSEEVEELKETLLPSLICSAASRGDFCLLQRLAVKGAKLSCSTYEGRTALHAAAARGQLEVVKLLLAQNVPLNTLDAEEYTPLVYAARKSHYEIVQLIYAAGGRLNLNSVVLGTELCNCVHLKDLAQLKAWKLAGADMNAMDYDRRTPLHVACTQGSREIVKYLLENGANATSEDVFGATPLDNAKTYKHPTVVRLLESHVTPPS